MHPTRLAATAVAFLSLAPTVRADIVGFEDLALPPGQFENGANLSGSFVSGGVTFGNQYSGGFWNGFAYSNVNDTTTSGFVNQYAAVTGTGRGGSGNYGVAYGYSDLTPTDFDPIPFDPSNGADLRSLPSLTLPAGFQAVGAYVTNATYAALSMLQGDGFAKKFGGPTGDDPDWLLLTAYGIDASGVPLPSFVELYLADYRFSDDALDYVLDEWAFLDLSPLSEASSLHFNLSSSDVSSNFGMSTPASFVIDDIRIAPAAVPEPSSFALLSAAAILAASRHPWVRRKSKPLVCLTDGDPPRADPF